MARPRIKPRTSDLRVRCPTDCTMRPSAKIKKLMVNTKAIFCVFIGLKNGPISKRNFFKIVQNPKILQFSPKIFIPKRPKIFPTLGKRPHLQNTWARDFKTFFMLNSVEHEILNADKYKKYQEIQLFADSDKPRMLFFLLIIVKMPTIFGILTFMSRKISCSIELRMKKVL